jgi:uncharacterized protein (DUF1800 family)
MHLRSFHIVLFAGILAGCGGSQESGTSRNHPSAFHVVMPWRESGLSERQAAAHLLNRFTFGPRPGDVDAVMAGGLDNWFSDQLLGDLPDAPLDDRLATLPVLRQTNEQLAALYPPPGQVLLLARSEGVLPPFEGEYTDSLGQPRKQYVDFLLSYGKEKGYLPQREVVRQLTAQKILRGVESRNQLAEVLVDFWFNHFNVSLAKLPGKGLVLTFERDAIRPHVFGRFREMLGSTARHPAMLQYLDNATSTAGEGSPTTMGLAINRYRNLPGAQGVSARRAIDRGLADQSAMQEQVNRVVPPGFRNGKGLNENYAREVMELHTLGVDGGYTQKDVTELARIFTGWTVYPVGPLVEKLREKIDRTMERAGRAGFMRDGDFLFRADTHDAGEKRFLGRLFPEGGGEAEGEEALDILAAHPSTAHHIARELAVKFVSETPSDTLVSRLAGLFTKTRGDLRAIVAGIAESPEFWAEARRRSKIKSPLELVVSAVRATGADVTQEQNLVQWVSRMGEPLYAYQAPTGYPDRGQFWINAGSLISRMNFGLAFAAGRIPGVAPDLPALIGGVEPESAGASLESYTRVLLAERDPGETVKRLNAVVRQVDLEKKISRLGNEAAMRLGNEASMIDDPEPASSGRRTYPPLQASRVVGLIIGSPEFQRH